MEDRGSRLVENRGQMEGGRFRIGREWLEDG